MLANRKTLLLALAVVSFIVGCGVMRYSGKFPQVDKSTAPGLVVNEMIVYREALALIDKLEYALAAPKLQQVTGQFESAGDTAHAAESMFWLGFCREKLHRDDQARQTYVTVIERFSESKPAEYAQQRLDAMNQP